MASGMMNTKSLATALKAGFLNKILETFAFLPAFSISVCCYFWFLLLPPMAGKLD
jgi:hypothetical protein